MAGPIAPKVFAQISAAAPVVSSQVSNSNPAVTNTPAVTNNVTGITESTNAAGQTVHEVSDTTTAKEAVQFVDDQKVRDEEAKKAALAAQAVLNAASNRVAELTVAWAQNNALQGKFNQYRGQGLLNLSETVRVAAQSFTEQVKAALVGVNVMTNVFDTVEENQTVTRGE